MQPLLPWPPPPPHFFFLLLSLAPIFRFWPPHSPPRNPPTSMFLSPPRPLPVPTPMPSALDLLRVNLCLPLSFPLRNPIPRAAASRVVRAAANGSKVGVKLAADELRARWLDSISCPLTVWNGDGLGAAALDGGEMGSEWVVGVDPDVSGALALLRSDGDGAVSAQVFDTPHLKVMVGKRTRKRPDAKAIVQLLRGLGAPLRTTAYIEQSIPFPQDGKLGWWNGGYTYGLWIGTLVASGFSVIPVPSRIWKDKFGLYGSSSSKDDSRRVASMLFPSVTSQLKRKKDHGRAEALLIAAHGKNLRLPECSNSQER